MAEPADRPFHVMVKPIGPICNLDCAYCYYLGKEGLLYDKGEKWRMSEDRLERFVRQYIASQAGQPQINFAWQGGEPTLMGVEFFRKAVELQQQHAPAGTAVTNSIQTNGTLLNDEWGAFFAEHNFLVGLSVDGPRELHDAFRVDKGGQPTFDKVMAGLSVLKKHNVDFNALVVVNRRNARKPLEVYRFFRDTAAVQYLQFIPCVERTDFVQVAPGTWPADSLAALGTPAARPGRSPASTVTPWSVDPLDYGKFLCAVFDEWVANDVGRMFVQAFDVALGQWLGRGSSLCVFAETCGDAMVLEHDGVLYACDHFVYPEYRLGSIEQADLAEMARSGPQRQFGADKKSKLPRYCRECEVRFACNGECPKNRFLLTPDGESGLNYLCAGLRKFFNHIDPWMRAMAGEVGAGRPAANVMAMVQSRRRAAAAERWRTAGPNDVCPCGSGKKYKKCCMGKVRA